MSNFQNIHSDLKQGKFSSLYFLYGEEAYFIDKISDYIEANAIDESSASFNKHILYGKDSKANQLIDLASMLPMMGGKQLIILKEAQQMRDIEQLQNYIAQPAPHTIVVITYRNKKPDKRKKFFKELIKRSVSFEAQKLRDYQVAAWIKEYVNDKSLNINEAATNLLAEYLGTDLSKLSNEMDKLAIRLKEGEEINLQLVEENIGISKDFNVFELQKALSQNKRKKIYRIADYFYQNPKSNPAEYVIASLNGYFSKIYGMHLLSGYTEKDMAKELKVNPYFMKDYLQAAKRFSKQKTEAVIDLIYQYDLKLKGVANRSVKREDLLKELIYRIAV